MTFDELNEVWTLKKKIASAKQQLAALRESAEMITSMLKPTPRGKKKSSRVELLATLIADTDAEISRLQARLQQAIPELTAKIIAEGLDSVGQTLLIYRYVACKYFRDIGFLMGYTRQHVHYLHKQILKKLDLI